MEAAPPQPQPRPPREEEDEEAKPPLSPIPTRSLADSVRGMVGAGGASMASVAATTLPPPPPPPLALPVLARSSSRVITSLGLAAESRPASGLAAPDRPSSPAPSAAHHTLSAAPDGAGLLVAGVNRMRLSRLASRQAVGAGCFGGNGSSGSGSVNANAPVFKQGLGPAQPIPGNYKTRTAPVATEKAPASAPTASAPSEPPPRPPCCAALPAASLHAGLLAARRSLHLLGGETLPEPPLPPPPPAGDDVHARPARLAPGDPASALAQLADLGRAGGELVVDGGGEEVVAMGVVAADGVATPAATLGVLPAVVLHPRPSAPHTPPAAIARQLFELKRLQAEAAAALGALDLAGVAPSAL